MDGSKGFITVELAHSNPNATIFWHLDDTIRRKRRIHKISLQPAAGKHSLTAVDEKATQFLLLSSSNKQLILLSLPHETAIKRKRWTTGVYPLDTCYCGGYFGSQYLLRSTSIKYDTP